MSWGAVMLKRLVRPIIRKVGFDVVRYHPILPAPGSTRTTSLTFYETATGKYFLPTDAQGDIVANALKSGGIFEEGGRQPRRPLHQARNRRDRCGRELRTDEHSVLTDG